MSGARRLFVYGTLRPGESNAHVLAGLAGQWQRAWLRARLYPEGIGRAAGYPAIILDDQAEWIEGCLLSSDALADFWPELDFFEGAAYERVQTPVRLASGEVLDAQVYTLNAEEAATHGRRQNL